MKQHERTMAEVDANIKALEVHIGKELGKINDFLVDRLATCKVKELEDKLAEALNPVSSRMGPLVHLENGIVVSHQWHVCAC